MRRDRMRFHLIPFARLIVVSPGMMGPADSSRTHHALGFRPGLNTVE